MLRIFKVLLFIFFSYSGYAQQPLKPVTITGRLVNGNDSTPRVMLVNFLNPFEKTRKSVELSENSDFFVYQNMVFTQNMTLAYNDKYINLYVVPGDSVHLEIDGSRLKEPEFKWLKITGDHAERSRQLNLVHRYINTLPNHHYDYSMSSDDILLTVKTDYNRYLGALMNYSSKQQLDPVILDFMKRDIRYKIANWISDYVDQGDKSPSSKQERIQLFKDAFFDNGNDSNFMSMMYPYYLGMNTDWATQSLRPVEQKSGEKSDLKTIEKGIRVILQEPPGLSRDYMLFTYLTSFLKKNPDLKPELSRFQQYFSSAEVFRYVVQTFDLDKQVKIKKSPINELSFLENDKVTNLSHVDFLATLQQKYPGKVIYLDIYATWCIPCLKEMEFAPALHESFYDQDVVFVNLCLQSPKESWMKLVKDREIHGENYFIAGDDSKAMMGNFNISGFPTYMLIDKQGEIRTMKAIRPSDLENAKKEIQELL